MNINLINNNHHNFTAYRRKVHTREPLLIQEIVPALDTNNTFSKLSIGKSNSQINNPIQMTDTQRALKAIEFDRMIQKQQIAKNRDWNILNRLLFMDKNGYEGICKNVSAEVLCALTKLKKETVSALNDFQLFRICEIQDGNRPTSEGLAELEKEFSTQELQRISERDNSTIINTWINKQTKSEESFECLTKYIHEIAQR